MRNIFKIAIRNLLRYRRRTALTASLIIVGLMFVLIFMSVAGSFRNMIIAQVTDSMMGHIQIHQKGYVASIDNLPLDCNLNPGSVQKLDAILNQDKLIEAYSERIKFVGMISNYQETTSIRLNGIKPEEEFKSVPLLTSRITEGEKDLKRGEIIVPILMAKGMNLKVGSPVVIVATNNDGSVNGKTLIVSGVMENVVGPMGRDGYIHFEDAVEILRMEKPEVSEVVVRLHDYKNLHGEEDKLKQILSKELNDKGKPIYEVHSWERLHPFANISSMIDIMMFFITIMLIAVVLISILNVMTMAVYERMREIGTVLAIGTLPSKISQMFLVEGLCIGIFGVLAGNLLSIIVIFVIKHLKITFSFLRMDGFVLNPQINPADFITVSIIVIIVSTLASLYPALKASSMDPVKTLRQI